MAAWSAAERHLKIPPLRQARGAAHGCRGPHHKGTTTPSLHELLSGLPLSSQVPMEATFGRRAKLMHDNPGHTGQGSTGGSRKCQAGAHHVKMGKTLARHRCKRIFKLKARIVKNAFSIISPRLQKRPPLDRRLGYLWRERPCQFRGRQAGNCQA